MFLTEKMADNMSELINSEKTDKNSLFRFNNDEKTYSTARFDMPKYPFLYRMLERMFSYFWQPSEISLLKDKQDFLNCTEDEQYVFIKNLQRQSLLDSIQSIHISTALSKVTDNPELLAIISWWSSFEVLHSFSYSYILRSIFENPTEIIDEIDQIDEFKFDINSFDYYYNKAHLNYDDLYRALCCSQTLEGIQFMSSFVMSFAFVEDKRLMSGNANILKLILRDENLHVSINSYLINLISDKVSAETRKEVRNFYKVIVENEKRWVDKLFGNKTIIGLNSTLLNEFIDHVAYVRMKSVDLEPLSYTPKNPIKWFNEWSTSLNLQVSPQELELTAYANQVIDSNKLQLDNIILE